MNTQEYLKYLLSTDNWTPEDRKWMQQYLEANELADLEAIALEAYKKDTGEEGPMPSVHTSQEILNRIHQHIEAPEKKVGFIHRHRRTLAIAASILVVVGAGFLVRSSFPGLSSGTASGTTVLKSVGFGERTTIKLPDGTAVTLEPGSLLEYPTVFTGDNRKVKLTGEAFFEVQKDPDHPFVISSRYLNTTVLGTSFAVDARSERQARVVVVTGKVKVESGYKNDHSGEVFITANQSAVLDTTTGKLEAKEARAEAHYYISRRQGKFNYINIPISQVVKDMERYFNGTVHIEGNIKDCRFNGYFTTTDDLEKALALVAATVNAKITIGDAGSYVLTGGTCD